MTGGEPACPRAYLQFGGVEIILAGGAEEAVETLQPAGKAAKADLSVYIRTRALPVCWSQRQCKTYVEGGTHRNEVKPHASCGVEKRLDVKHAL